MTDLEIFTNMLARAGIKSVRRSNSEEIDFTAATAIHIDVDSQPHGKSVGYSGFETVAYFNDKGELITIGAWE